MTDETVGPELPAATGGWTNGRARGGASIRNQLLRPGRMLGEGREQARALPSSHPFRSHLWFALSSDCTAFIVPSGKGRARK